jgi:AraC-like DNA-binding protein
MLEKYYISKKDNTDLNVYRCGFEECVPGHSWGPGVRDHFSLHVILSGQGSFSLNGNTYVLKAGQGFLIWPGQIVHYQADSTVPWTYSWVGFHGLKAEAILKKAGLSVQNPTFDFDPEGPLIESLHHLIAAARNEKTPELMLTGYLFLFLANLLELQRKVMASDEKASSSDRYVSRAVEYIEKNYGGPLSVEDLAGNLRIDRSYLSALFKRYLGLPPREFIIGYRMDKACELLKNPQLSIGDVARSVGYEDPLQFSKTFRKTKGESPLKYRKKLNA